MDEVSTKITLETLREKGFKPHRLNGSVPLYEKDGIIIQIVPFINIVNVMEEGSNFEYPRLVKRNIETWENLEKYISDQSRTQ